MPAHGHVPALEADPGSVDWCYCKTVPAQVSIVAGGGQAEQRHSKGRLVECRSLGRTGQSRM